MPDLEPVRVVNAPVGAGLATPQGDVIALQVAGSIAIYDVEELTKAGQFASPLPPGEAVTGLAFAADGVLIVGGGDGSLAVLSVDGRSSVQLDSPHETRIERIRTSGKRAGLFASIDASGTATAWRLGTDGDGVVAASLDLGEHGFGVADAGIGVGGTTLWTVSTTSELAEWVVTDDGLELISEGVLPSVDGLSVADVGMAVHPHDRVIVAADVSGVLYRWPLGERPTVLRPIDIGTYAEHIDLFADGTSIVVGGRGEVWLGALDGNQASGPVVWNAPPGEEILDVAISANGRLLAVATVTGVHGLARADDASWDEHWTWSTPDLLGAQFVGNDQVAAAAESGLFVMLDALSGKPRLEGPLVEHSTWGPMDNLVDFSVSQSGRVALGLGSCGSYACDQIVDVGGRTRREIEATTPGVILGDLDLVAYVDDYTHVDDLVVSESRIRIIGSSVEDTRDSTIRVPLRAMDLIGSTDEQIMLVVAEGDSRVDESHVRLHDTATAEQLGEDIWLETDMGDADLAPDGDLVAVVTDGEATIYDADAFHPDRVVTQACDVLGRNAHGFEWDDLAGGRPHRDICPRAPPNFFDLTKDD